MSRRTTRLEPKFCNKNRKQKIQILEFWSWLHFMCSCSDLTGKGSRVFVGFFHISSYKADKWENKGHFTVCSWKQLFAHLKRLCWATTLYTITECVMRTKNPTDCINLSFMEQESLFSSIKASRGSDIAGRAYKCQNSHSKKAMKQINFTMHIDYLSSY